MRLRGFAIPALTGLVVATFAFTYLTPLPAALPGPDFDAVAIFVGGVFLLVTAVVYLKRSRTDPEVARGPVWDIIPSWQ